MGAALRPCPSAFVLAGLPTATNDRLRDAFEAAGCRSAFVSPVVVAAAAWPGDLVLGRIDVRPTLDGIQPGLDQLRALSARGVTVVNDAAALVACHDKLVTAVLLCAASVPQPDTFHALDPGAAPAFGPPYVAKPRFGSWGRDVVRCASRAELRAWLHRLERRSWFRRQGALVQELIPPRGYDLRLVVSAGAVVGAVERVAAEGEWRTNIALGGRRRATEPPPEACEIAIRAAAAVGGDLVGVDLLPEEGGWRVVEVNGAAEFTDEYALDDRDVFELAVEPFVAAALPALAV